jgi:hypothetical protein
VRTGPSAPAVTSATSHDRADLARVLTAGVVVGVLDGLFAVGLSAAVSGTFAPARVFQGIARALLGPTALDGGLATAALGLVLHLAIACAWAGAFLVALRHSAPLRRAVARPAGAVAVGMAYGALVWVVMRLVVIPLSRAPAGPVVPRTFLILLVGHLFVVGLPIALVVRPRAAP